MIHKELETVLNNLIANDNRPVGKRKYALAGGTKKRTHITHVEVIPAGSTQDIIQTTVANQGTTVQGILRQQPMTPKMVAQGQLSDCWILAAVLSIIFVNPNFFDDIIYPIDASNVVVQYFWNGNVIRIHTSLLVSTSYNNPNDDDVRVELIEKTFGLLRTGISDYLKDNWGMAQQSLAAVGLDAKNSALLSTATIAVEQAAGCIFCLQTMSSAPNPWVASHVYSLRTILLGNPIIQNVWYGGTDIIAAPADILNPAIFAILVIATFPKVKRLVAPTPPPIIVPAPNPMPIPTPLDALRFDLTVNPPMDAHGTVTVDSGGVVKVEWKGTNADTITFTDSLYKSKIVYKPLDYFTSGYANDDVLTFTAARVSGGTSISKTIKVKIATPQAPAPPTVIIDGSVYSGDGKVNTAWRFTNAVTAFISIIVRDHDGKETTATSIQILK